jgi:hypothetical protein
MSLAKSAIKRGTMQRIAGLDMPMMMIMEKKKFMLPMVLTPIGTRTPVPLTISPGSSTI